MDYAEEIAGLILLAMPAIVTFFTEVAKRIPQIPTPSKSVKFWALGFAVVITVGWYYLTGGLNPESVSMLAIHTVLNYTAAVGIYESLKKLLEKI